MVIIMSAKVATGTDYLPRHHNFSVASRLYRRNSSITQNDSFASVRNFRFLFFFVFQTVVFRDIDYSDLVRVEILGMRKIGENPVLASVEFEVRRGA